MFIVTSFHFIFNVVSFLSLLLSHLCPGFLDCSGICLSLFSLSLNLLNWNNVWFKMKFLHHQCVIRDRSGTEIMAFVVVYTPSELPLSITCVFPSWLWTLCDADAECVAISSLSQPAARVLLQKTVETKKVEIKEGIPSEGKADLLQLSFLLCCAMHKSKFKALSFSTNLPIGLVLSVFVIL